MLTLPPPALPSAECLVLGTICAPPSRVYTPTVQYASILRATSWGSGTVRRWDGRGGGARYWREDEISNGFIPESDSSWYLRICAAVSSFPASTTGESTIIQDKIPVCTLPNVPSGTGWAVGWTMGCGIIFATSRSAGRLPAHPVYSCGVHTSTLRKPFGLPVAPSGEGC